MIFLCPLVIGGGGMAIFQDQNGEINETTETIIIVLAVITTAFFIIKSFMLSIKYNKSLLVGLFIGLMKTVIAILGVLIVIGYIGELTDGGRVEVGLSKDIIPKLTVEFKVPVVTDQFKPKVKDAKTS